VGIRISAALTAAILAAGCASTSGRTGSPSPAGPTTRSDAALHTFEIDTTWTGEGQPTVTQRRLVDNDSQQREVLPSSQEGGSIPDIIDDGNTSYVNLTGSTCKGVDVTGVTWERVAKPPLSAAGARMTDPFDYPLTMVSPAEALAELSPIVTAIRPDGKMAIDGVSTSKFLLTVSSGAMEILMDGGQMAGPTDPAVHFAVAMWVDADNRLRQSQVTVMAPGQSNGTVTNRYNHFGMPVNITIPPASEVVQNC